MQLKLGTSSFGNSRDEAATNESDQSLDATLPERQQPEERCKQNDDQNDESMLQTRVLTVLGGASYSIYLLQVPVLHRFADATSTYMHIIVCLFVLIAFSVLVFFVWEQPARRWIRNAAH